MNFIDCIGLFYAAAVLFALGYLTVCMVRDDRDKLKKTEENI